MRSPDRTDVDRIEGLLRGVPPETEREARLEGLMRELRAAPVAPAEVRERVRALRAEPGPTRRRRSALVVVPVAALLVAGVIAVAQLPSDGGDGEGGGSAAAPDVRLQAPAGEAQDSTALQESARTAAPVPAPAGVRAQEWDVALELRVPDNDRLGEASAEAIAATRRLGGFVVSSNVSTSGRSGESRIVVRVPSERVQDAIAELSALGTITAQNVSIQDRQGDLDRLARRIDALRVEIAGLNLRLRTESLSEPERLRLELRRQRLTAQVNGAAAERRGVRREVDLAEVSLVLRTGEAAAAPAPGRIEGAARDALHVLGLAGAVAVFLGIVLAPVALAAVLALAGRRSWRRREAERLLEGPRPAGTR